jgi:glucose-6-phosphate 1-epimerase
MTNTADLMQSLYSQFGELPGISIELHQDLIAIAVATRSATATVFLQGAQVSQYGLKDQPPILWLSPLCDYQAGQALRGGVPVCWPWFGELAKNPGTVSGQINHPDPPAHGFVRNRDWQLLDVQIHSPAHTRLLLGLEITAGSEPLWPFASELQLEIDISESLQISLTSINRDNRAFYFSSALHSYFNIGAIDKVTVEGLSGLSYIDALDNWKPKQQQGLLDITGEVDRIYQKIKQPLLIHDKGHDRFIEVSSHGSESAVIWNPWQDKARRLSCFPAQAYQHMLCIEPACALEDCIELQPGQSHKLLTKICTHCG